MYEESIGSRKTLGDVDVLFHEGIYHLFHLVLPNHDYIAHAVSEDGFSWRRVRNAVFIGHPGDWDDSMLWTMHVSPDPHQVGRWRMFYTGLSRRDRGLKQRLGMATSDDLYHWTKSAVSWKDHRDANIIAGGKGDRGPRSPLTDSPYDKDSSFPLEPDCEHYESSIDEPRQWVSWRDPFYYREGDRGYLLCAGRVNQGPLVRRGCVAVMQETDPNHFETRPPLFHPGQYDDIEVPNLFQIDGEYYLIGSLREDAKIRYWHTDALGKPWRAYHDNVLLARGNYAGRLCRDETGYLIWNFFTHDIAHRTQLNIMPPPKRLTRMPNGMLRVRSFEGFNQRFLRSGNVSSVKPLQCSVQGQPMVDDQSSWQGDSLRLSSEAGFEAFVFPDEVDSFRFCATLDMCGLGKCGLVFRLDPHTRDGYYVSLDMTKGIAQVRAWGTGPDGSGEHMMQFRSLQSGFWQTDLPGRARIELIAYGSYIELSIDGRVILSLADQTYTHGQLGIYAETATMDVTDARLDHLREPAQSDVHLPTG
ncbi:hypothetical protein K227x_30740 [Rubripirellula lacrimiformis]|uniref:Glycosyl hydrolase family 32 N-terminal domain-containing protein n=1 Tax=Rubripirellula lacrimiformis TaxID=1930273 RepID=A0A517NC23_9BACT|nr:glycosyl hydrolase [Rubripirellula lacrimiformis]QDT04680.1 hypothetical protein K227x_30740 [Rubripirellula lacrimiformis]